MQDTSQAAATFTQSAIFGALIIGENPFGRLQSVHLIDKCDERVFPNRCLSASWERRSSVGKEAPAGKKSIDACAVA